MEGEKQTVKKQPLPLPAAAYKDTHTNGNKSPRHQPTNQSSTTAVSDKEPRNNDPRESSLSNGINPLYAPRRKCSTLHRESEISLEEYGPELERLECEKLAELKRRRSRNDHNQTAVQKEPHPQATATNNRREENTQTKHGSTSQLHHELQLSTPSKDQLKVSEATRPPQTSNVTAGSLAEQARAGVSVEELALLVISKAQQLNISMEVEPDTENRTSVTSGQFQDDGKEAADLRAMSLEQMTSLVNKQAQHLNIDGHTSPTLDRDGGRYPEGGDDSSERTQDSAFKFKQGAELKKKTAHGNNDDSDDFMDDEELTMAVSETLKSKSVRVTSPTRTQNLNGGSHSPSKQSSACSPSRHPHTYHGRPNTTKGSSPLCPPRQQPVANLNEHEKRLIQAKKGRKAPMPDVSNISWYHPGISRHIAECLLLSPDMKDGTYLLRDSVSSEDSLTVSVRCQNSVKHYRVEWNGKQFCFGLGKFTTVDALIEHFDNQPMISGDSDLLLQLSHPYPRGISEPSVYEHPAIVVHSDLSVSEEPENSKKRWSDRPLSWRKKRDMETFNVSASSIVPPPLSINSKEGFLTKLGQHRKNWKRRWFVLYRNELKYYNTREDKEPLKIINLEDVSAVETDDMSGKTNCFRLVTSYRTFFMFADTPSEASDWIQILEWKIKNMMSSSIHTQLSLAISDRQN